MDRIRLCHILGELMPDNEQAVLSYIGDLRAEVEELRKDKARLTTLLCWAHEIVCRIPGGIHCVDSREDIDNVIAAHAARSEGES